MSDKDELFDFSRNRPEPKVELRYNREERLKKAPENVQKLHRGEYTKKMGLLKRLFSTPAHSMLAIAILLMLAFIAFYQRRDLSKPKVDFEADLELAIPEPKMQDTAQNQKKQDTAQNQTSLFATAKIKPKTQNQTLKGEEITVLFMAVDKNDMILVYEQVSSVYLCEPLTLTCALSVPQMRENIKAINAQVQIQEQRLLLSKKL